MAVVISVRENGDSDMPKSTDEKKRDEILKRMLQTPHKPHVVPKKKKPVKKTGSKKS